jgi:hypothetical protein
MIPFLESRAVVTGRNIGLLIKAKNQKRILNEFVIWQLSIWLLIQFMADENMPQYSTQDIKMAR